MTASHAFTLGKVESPMCACGQDRETVNHLVFHCTMQPECPLHLRTWESRPPAHSCAFLCPLPCNKDDRDLWRLLCRRVVAVLSRLHPQEECFDWKGHVAAVDLRSEYVYCIRCLTCRKLKDAKHLAAKPCEGALWGHPIAAGEYLKSSGHTLRLNFRPWKVAARRPALQCILYNSGRWPPYAIPRSCPRHD